MEATVRGAGVVGAFQEFLRPGRTSACGGNASYSHCIAWASTRRGKLAVLNMPVLRYRAS